MKIILTITMFALTINAYSQKLVKEHYDWAKTKIKKEYYTNAYGALNGSFKAYSEYGGILKQGQCKDGGPIGKWIENYDNGKLHYIKYYETPGTNNFQVINGKIISYYEDGKSIKYERNFKNMDLDGDVKEYDENGTLIKEGKYINGEFERTGESKRIYDEEQKVLKQKQKEDNAERYNDILPKADKALIAKDYNNALLLYKSASALIEDEKYPEEKISEIIATLNANTKFFSDYIKEQRDTLTNDYNKLKVDFKIKSIKEFNQNTYKYEDKRPKSVYMSYKSCDCKNPWNEVYQANILSCFELNKEFYEPYQIAITNSFFKFYKVLGDKENAVEQFSINNFEFNNIKHSFSIYDKELFINNIDEAKIEYNKAKSMMPLALKFDENVKKIENLNNENKKKTLFKKYSLVLADFQTKYNTDISVDECIIILNEANSFLEKVISLYSSENEELEKKLKNIETIENIKSMILGK